MTSVHRPVVILVATLIVLTAFAAGRPACAQPADEATDDAAGAAGVDARLDLLEARLARFRAAADQRLVDDDRADAVRTLVSDLLADVDTRAALLDDPATSGYDGGFFIASPDGRFRLDITGQLQNRLTWNRRKRGEENRTDTEFIIRRAKLKFDGQIKGSDIGFTIGTAFQDTTGELRLQSFVTRFRLSDELTLFVGRRRPPLLREEAVSSKRQLAAERSLIASVFRQERTMGVTMQYQNDRFRVLAGVMDAGGELFGAAETWRTSGRAEWLLTGRWKELADFTSFHDAEPTVAMGVGALYQEEDRVLRVEPDTRRLRWSADLTVELAGATVFASIVGNREDREGDAKQDQYGVVVQGGLFVTDEWELFTRYEWGDADTLGPDLSLVTLGVNYYLREHELKFTFDVGYGVNEISDFWASSGAGYDGDRSGMDGQVTVRSQFQLLF